MKYTKTNDSQVVLSEQINSSGSMISGGSISIPITIASSAIKNALLLQSPATGNFYVNIAFTVEEDYSGKSSSYTNIPLGTVEFQ
ncbi:MAG: hypothetical protein A2079_06075 [Geobacteraceae bacterium GWC2_48_7]|nr:MAG: hypothetical protein A2X80_00480 [Geobacteraceae bacterium GWB2_52_12]OGT98057.1 MAG: hypothetical protein A2079_06075 [Geobacteraceae bacterium GWC2_48_7]